MSQETRKQLSQLHLIRPSKFGKELNNAKIEIIIDYSLFKPTSTFVNEFQICPVQRHAQEILDLSKLLDRFVLGLRPQNRFTRQHAEVDLHFVVDGHHLDTVVASLENPHVAHLLDRPLKCLSFTKY